MDTLKNDDYKPSDRPTAKKIRKLLEKQDYRCAMTGIELTPETANLDHIVPVASGGKHTMGNVQVVHKTINRIKSTLPKDEFIEWCRRIVEHSLDNGKG